MRRGTAAAQHSRMPPRHAGRGRGMTAQMRLLPEDRGMIAQTRPLQGDRGMTPRMHCRPDCNNKAAQMHHRQGGASTTARMPLHPGGAGMTAQMHPRPGGADMTAPAPALLVRHRSVPTAGLSASELWILRLSLTSEAGWHEHCRRHQRERLSVRGTATLAVWRCRLSRMTRMPARPGGGQQQGPLPTPALHAGARLP